MVEAKELSFKYVITFNMDEYVFPQDAHMSAKNPNVRTTAWHMHATKPPLL